MKSIRDFLTVKTKEIGCKKIEIRHIQDKFYPFAYITFDDFIYSFKFNGTVKDLEKGLKKFEKEKDLRLQEVKEIA